MLKSLESESFKTPLDASDEAMILCARKKVGPLVVSLS
ncbi:hypothetical protein EMIT051CA3_30155 [Pseudomonas chlororaphis]